MRQANAVDFWRGVALVMIFVNHMPGHWLSFYTLRNFAISDAAELFVFLAGWSLSYATGGPAKPDSAKLIAFRLLSRAIELYRMHIFLTVLALATLAATAHFRQNPIFIEWHNAGPAFYDPIRAFIGLVLLVYQLGFFNILPLYIVLLVMAVPLIILLRWRLWAGIGASLAVYVFALVTRISLPHWPANEPWYFNPLCWQLLIMMGFVGAELTRSSEAFRRWMRLAIWPSLVLIALGVYIVRHELWPDPTLVPEPRMLFIFNKTYLTPARVVSLLAWAIAMQMVFRYLYQWIKYIPEWLCSLGRNSLPVFAVASLVSLYGQIARFIFGGNLIVDTISLLLGLGLMGFTAWFVEWRSRSGQPLRLPA